MTALTEFATTCEMCGTEFKTTGTYWGILDRGRILSLCDQCSQTLKTFIEDMKETIKATKGAG